MCFSHVTGWAWQCPWWLSNEVGLHESVWGSCSCMKGKGNAEGESVQEVVVKMCNRRIRRVSKECTVSQNCQTWGP